jgi:hypothetical protein
MKLKTMFIIGLFVVLVETLLFGVLVYGGKPEPSVAIGLIVIVPTLFALNIIVGLILYLGNPKH